MLYFALTDENPCNIIFSLQKIAWRKQEIISSQKGEESVNLVIFGLKSFQKQLAWKRAKLEEVIPSQLLHFGSFCQGKEQN